MTPDNDPHSFDPFRAAAAGESSTTTRCPKCQWAQSPDRTSCAACGLIFARYAAAQARASSSLLSSDVSASSDGSSWPSTSAAFAAPDVPPSFGPGTASAGSIVGSAVSSSMATVLTLLGLHMVPLLAAGALGAVIAASVPFVMQAWPQLNGASFVVAVVVLAVVGVVTWLLALRVTSTISVAAMLTVDDHQRTGDTRGVFAALGEGWDHAVRAMGVIIATGALAAVPALPVLWAWTKMPAMLIVAAAWVAFVVVRLALAMPAVVLGDRSVVGALRESWALTSERFFETAGVVILGGLVMMVVSGVCAALSWIPLIGAVVGVAGSVVVTGIGVGVSAALWRDRVEA